MEEAKQVLTIDKLMRDKMADFVLIEERPQMIRIYEKFLYVGNFTLQTEQSFFQEWAKILGLLKAKIANMELSDTRKTELLKDVDFDMLANGKSMLRFIWKDKWLNKKLMKLIKNTLLKQQAYYLPLNAKDRKKIKWINCSYRYFKKYVSKENLLQICALIYYYNFDAVKKNLKILVEKMNIKQQTETYMYSWLENMAGVHGKFLLAQAPSIDYAFRDKANKPEESNKKEKDK
jgi:hypothetical protein